MTQCDESIYRQLQHIPTVLVVCGVPGSGKSY